MGTRVSSPVVSVIVVGVMAMMGVPTPARAATATDNQAAPPGSDRLNEPAVAVDPRDPQRVVTAANDLDTGPVGVYTSLDGANTFWRASLLPLLDGTHTEADPGLAFDRLGRAYASYVSYDRTSQSNFDFSRGGLAVARSDDGGLSWPSAVLAMPNHNDSSGCFFADFPSIDVARGASGQAADTVYVAWQSPGASGADCSQLSMNGSRIGVARSDDGGRTWHALPFPPPSAGISPYLPVVYAGGDGSVHVAYDETHDADDPTACFGQGHVHVMVASSTDGGQTWITSEAHSGSCYGVETDPQPPVGVGLASLNGALYRLPASTNVVKDPRTGVLVSVAGDGDSTGGWVVDVASSMDSRQWTRGAVPARTPGEMQEFPRLAVAPDGTLSLLWISELPGSVLTAKLAISVDDGRSWGDPITLSSQPGVSHLSSRPDASPLSHRPDGSARWTPFIGDYIANAFGADGAAHPVWTDVRTTPSRIYTAHVNAPRPASEPTTPTTCSASTRTSSPNGFARWGCPIRPVVRRRSLPE